MGAPSQRQLQVGELARHALTTFLQRGELYDDVISKAFITIPEVRLSPDLKIATVYVNTLNGVPISPIIKALAKNKHFIRLDLAKKLQMKYAPDLRFRPDETIEEATRIDTLLRSVKP
jgi:ribosome-binding factor A